MPDASNLIIQTQDLLFDRCYATDISGPTESNKYMAFDEHVLTSGVGYIYIEREMISVDRCIYVVVFQG